MDIGIPKQRRPFDYRVGLTPMGVEILTGLGHRVYVERDAGQGSGFEDDRYTRAARHRLQPGGGLRPGAGSSLFHGL